MKNNEKKLLIPKSKYRAITVNYKDIKPILDEIIKANKRTLKILEKS